MDIIKPHLGFLQSYDWKQDPLFEGLIGCWPMVEGGGNRIADISGYNNHGTIEGATWVGTPWGPGLSFDGTDDYVNCGDMHNWGDDLGKTADPPVQWRGFGGVSWLTWIRTSSSSRQCLIGHDLLGWGDDPCSGLILNQDIYYSDEPGEHFASGILLDDGVVRASCEGQTTVYDGQWHCFGASLGGELGTPIMFYDGVDVADSTVVDDITFKEWWVQSHMSIGAMTDTDAVGHDHFFNGQMALVMMWNRYLPIADAVKLYRLGPGGIFRTELNPSYYGAILGSGVNFNAAFALNSNQVL